MKNSLLKTILSLFIATAMGITVVLVLYWYADARAVRAYDFNRNVRVHTLPVDTVINLVASDFNFAGADGNELWLSRSYFPPRLLHMDSTGIDSVSLKGITDSVQVAEVHIDPPYFYVVDAGRYQVYRGNLNTLTIEEKLVRNTFFSEAIPVSAASVILRSIGEKDRIYILEKKSRTTSLNTAANDLLEKQVDGLFCTDGKLHYASGMQQLVYVYFYRNEFIVADTSLNLAYRAHTIDPIERAQIEVAEIKSERASRFSKPPLMVNEHSAVYQHYLFIHSPLASQTEDPDEFRRVSVVDVYDLADRGKYRFSFYVPEYANKKVNRFIVTRSRFVAIHGQYLIEYSFVVDSLLREQGP